MNSIIRSHPVRLQDLQPFLHGYDPNKPIEPDAWAKSESAQFELGTLLFGLEIMATPSRFSQAAKKEADTGVSYRVKDLSIVVSLENERPLVISITASAYEERFLEVLLLEKARKAILDDKEFVYVAAAPSQRISEATSKELGRLGGVYAQGGSRRSLMADAGGPSEPVLALLDALGVRFAHSGGKTPLDIGLVCHLLFASESRQDDKSKTLIKTCFTPIEARSQLPPPVSDFDPNHFAFAPPELEDAPQAPVLKSSESLYEKPGELKDEEVSSFDRNKDDQPYKNLADAISGLTSGQQITTSLPSTLAETGEASADIVSGAGMEMALSLSQELEPTSELRQQEQLGMSGAREDLAMLVGGVEGTNPDSLHVSQVDIAKYGTLSLETSARKTLSGTEPKLVLNEMASLMSKLEQQVAKASKRLASRAEDIENRLNKLNESLFDEAVQDDRDVEASLLVLCDNLAKEIEEASEELAEKISQVASDAREDVKGLLEKAGLEIDGAEKSIQSELQSVCQTFQSETDALVRENNEILEKLLSKNLVELEALLKITLERLSTSTDDQVVKLNERFDKFRERMVEEANAVLLTVDRNVSSMGEEIEGSWQRASEKLKSTQSDFEQTVLHAVRVAELTLARAARTLLVEQFAPRLKERKEIFTTMVVEMDKTFSDQSGNQMRGQLMGLEASLASARQQLQALADDSLARIDSVGRDQQSVLEELFKETGGYIEGRTAEVAARLQQAEEQILESEAVCKKVAETFSLDADPVLTEERNSALASVHAQRSQMKKDLEDAAELNCNKLEDLAHEAQTQAKAKRAEQIQLLREASESGLNRIRESIQEAFGAIQSAREKQME